MVRTIDEGKMGLLFFTPLSKDFLQHYLTYLDWINSAFEINYK